LYIATACLIKIVSPRRRICQIGLSAGAGAVSIGVVPTLVLRQNLAHTVAANLVGVSESMVSRISEPCCPCSNRSPACTDPPMPQVLSGRVAGSDRPGPVRLDGCHSPSPNLNRLAALTTEPGSPPPNS
jgi:hypothetical protein